MLADGPPVGVFTVGELEVKLDLSRKHVHAGGSGRGGRGRVGFQSDKRGRKCALHTAEEGRIVDTQSLLVGLLVDRSLRGRVGSLGLDVLCSEGSVERAPSAS